MSGTSEAAESIRESAYEAIRRRGLNFTDDAQAAFESALDRAEQAVTAEPDRYGEALRNLEDLLAEIQSRAQAVRLADGSSLWNVTGDVLAWGFRRKCPKWPYC